MKLVKKLPVYTRISRHQPNISRDIHYYLFTSMRRPLLPMYEISACEWVPFDAVEDKLTYPEDKDFFRSILNEITVLLPK